MRIAVLSDGTYFGTHIIDKNTGQHIRNVTSFEITAVYPNIQARLFYYEGGSDEVDNIEFACPSLIADKVNDR